MIYLRLAATAEHDVVCNIGQRFFVNQQRVMRCCCTVKYFCISAVDINMSSQFVAGLLHLPVVRC